MAERRLPDRFAALAPFIKDWALADEQARYRKLHSSTLEELRDFYSAMLPRMEEILPCLDEYKVGAMPEDVETLFDLAMTFSETAHPIDLRWEGVDFTLAYPWEKLEFRSVSAGG